MSDKPFRIPLFLTLDSYSNYCASSAWDALDYLERHWPAERGPKYARALSVCQSALDGWVDAEVARDAITAAAREAKLLERHWRPGRVADHAAA